MKDVLVKKYNKAGVWVYHWKKVAEENQAQMEMDLQPVNTGLKQTSGVQILLAP